MLLCEFFHRIGGFPFSFLNYCPFLILLEFSYYCPFLIVVSEDAMSAPAIFYEWVVAPFVRGMHKFIFGVALWFASLATHYAAARWAARHGYKPQYAFARCEIVATISCKLKAFIRAAYPGCLQLLTQRGAEKGKHDDVHKIDKDELTAAHRAAMQGDREALSALLDAGCEIDATDSCDMTPLMYAADQGHVECLQLLLQHGADFRKRGKYGFTAAHYAVKRDHKGALSILLNAGCEIDATDRDDEKTPLMCAAHQGHVECLQLLVQHGADVHKRDKYGRTAAHWAEVNDHKEALLVLLDAGCEVDATDSNELTPLMCAVYGGHVECLQLLIQRGADVKCQKKWRIETCTRCPRCVAMSLRCRCWLLLMRTCCRYLNQ